MKQYEVTFEINGKEYFNESEVYNPHLPDIKVSEDLPESLPNEIFCYLKNSFGDIRKWRMSGLTKTGPRSFRFISAEKV